MKTPEQLKREIMGRVYMGYAIRRVWSFAMLRFAVFAGAIAGILSFVSIRHVIQNMPNPTDFNASYGFVSVAIKNTEFAVQLSLLAIFTVGVFTAVQMLKGRQVQRSTFA
ncbi:MAG: hypothetical protein AAB513_02900 [Patescibacteria group bacterium]